MDAHVHSEPDSRVRATSAPTGRAIIPSHVAAIRLSPIAVSLRERSCMKKISRFGLGILATLTAFCVLTSDGRAQNEVVLSYVTFYGFDDNDDGNPTHLGTDVISHAVRTRLGK